jgi:hypothetical protein
VSEFVAWCQEQPWYDNTTIVISGDHLTMDADFCDNVADDYERRVYTCYINAAAKNAAPEKTRDYTTFDDFPTTLSALGCTIEGERLGLGTNLFSGKETLTERDGARQMNLELSRRSEFTEERSGVSRKALATRAAIEKMNPKLSIKELDDGTLYCRVTGLEDLSSYSDVVDYVYLHIRSANQLSIFLPKLMREPDGSYAVSFSPDYLEGNKDITCMVRIVTTDGTIDMTDAIPYSLGR